MDEAINAWFPPTSTSVPFSFEVGVFLLKKPGADERKIRFSENLMVVYLWIANHQLDGILLTLISWGRLEHEIWCSRYISKSGVFFASVKPQGGFWSRSFVARYHLGGGFKCFFCPYLARSFNLTCAYVSNQWQKTLPTSTVKTEKQQPTSPCWVGWNSEYLCHCNLQKPSKISMFKS